MSSRAGVCSTLLIAIVALGIPGRGHTDLRIDGDRLTVATKNLRAVFQGGEIVEVSNRLTGEHIAYGIARRQPLTVMVSASGEPIPLRSDGWRRGHQNAEGREAAQTVLRNPGHTVWLNVVLDRENEDISISAWGEASAPGVRGYRLAVRNLDLTSGRLIAPASDGFEYGNEAAPLDVQLDYPSRWLAQMWVWQAKEGGIVCYSRDDEYRCKALNLSRRGNYLDVAMETRADGPWSSQSSVPILEWRLNAFKGHWQVPASGYRRLMGVLWPRATPPETRLWAGQIEKVVEAPAGVSTAWLSEMAKTSIPAKTLLLLREWFTSGPPDYRMTDAAATFIGRAHDRGFYVMVPLRVQYARTEWLARKQLKGAGSAGPDIERMHPASPAWRRALIHQLRDTFGGARPDALLLLDVLEVIPDAEPSSGRGGLAGLIALLQDLQKAFPDMVFTANGVNEVILPYIRVVRRADDGQKPPHPITAYLFDPSVVRLPWAPP